MINFAKNRAHRVVTLMKWQMWHKPLNVWPAVFWQTRNDTSEVDIWNSNHAQRSTNNGLCNRRLWSIVAELHAKI